MLGDKVRGERATYNSKKSLGYANLLDLFKKEILCNTLLLQVEVHRYYSLLKHPAMLHGTQSGARQEHPTVLSWDQGKLALERCQGRHLVHPSGQM